MQFFKQGLISTRYFSELAWARLLSRERRLYRQFEPLRESFFDDYWRKVAVEIEAEIDAVGYGFYRLKKYGKTTFVRRGEVMLDDHLTLSIAGNKPLVHRLLQEQGFNTPDYLEYSLQDLDKALAFMQGARGNYVVKPASGAAGGRGVTTRINSRERLIKASYRAAAFTSNRKLLIEKECPGKNYRLLYLEGKFLDAIKRESPGVTGDGKASLKELVQRENRARLETASALSPLTLDLDARYTLADQGLSPAHVPAARGHVQVKTTSNQYGRRENHSVKTEIHPSIIEYGRKVSGVIHVALCGVDMMLRDHTVPVEGSGCIINEINTTPGLHHHCLVANPQDETRVSASILNHIFENMHDQEFIANA